MKRTFLASCFLLLFLSSAGGAVTMADLSDELSELMPGKDIVTVKLKDGTVYEGAIISESDAVVSLEISRGGIIMTRTLSRSTIDSITAKDISEDLAKALIEYEIDPDGKWGVKEYEHAVKLFDEFLALCPKSDKCETIRSRRMECREKLKAMGADTTERGGHGRGRDREPVAAEKVTIEEYESVGREMRALEAENPGIEKPNYSRNKEAKTRYDELVRWQKRAMRSLPEMTKTLVGRHLANEDFDSAVSEIDRFLKAWAGSVLNSADKKQAANVDFSFVMSLERRIMRDYLKKGKGSDPLPSDVVLPRNMAYVPGGYFLMGVQNGGAANDNFPMRIVYVSPFLIDRYEVRNREYNEFVAYAQRTGDPDIEHPMAPTLKDHTSGSSGIAELASGDYPVMGVDWLDAYAYAAWAEKRLPTEAEWEKAARGVRRYKYPWGSGEPGARPVSCPSGRDFLATDMDRQCPPAQPNQGLFVRLGFVKPTPPVKTSLPATPWFAQSLLAPAAAALEKDGKYKPALTSVSPYLLFHMAGNAHEWVNDWYDPKYYLEAPVKDPRGPEKGTYHVYRGGCYLSKDEELVTTWRGAPTDKKREAGLDGKGKPIIGFRCVMSLDDVTR